MNHLSEIITALAAARVDFIICGGVALVLHGVERMTMVLDISLDMAVDNVDRFLQVMKSLDLVPRAPVPAESLRDPASREFMVKEKNALVFTFIDIKNPYRQVDVVIANQMGYALLRESIDTMDIGGYRVNLVSSEKLIEMKKMIRPLRDKDAFDIRALEKILGRG